MADMTPADLSAMMGNNNNMGGGAWWIIILFLFMMGNGGWNGRGNSATDQEILFNQHFNALDNKIDRIGNGIADATFALSEKINGEGRALQTQMAQASCDIKGLIRDDGDKTRALIQQNEMQQLRDKVYALEADARMCGVVKYPLSMSYAAGGNPFCNYPAGGCGCGNI